MINQILKLSFFIIFAIGLMASCQKKPSTPAPPSPAMSATINGNPWTASIITCMKISNTSDSIAINGSLNELDGIEFYMVLPSSAPGTYVVGTSAKLFLNDGKRSYNGISGNIVITSNSDNIISGNFDAKCQYSGTGEIMNISNGTFTAKIQ